MNILEINASQSFANTTIVYQNQIDEVVFIHSINMRLKCNRFLIGIRGKLKKRIVVAWT